MSLNDDCTEIINRFLSCGIGNRNLYDVQSLVKYVSEQISQINEFTKRTSIYDEYLRKNESYYITGIKKASFSIYTQNYSDEDERLLLYYRRLFRFLYPQMYHEDISEFKNGFTQRKGVPDDSNHQEEHSDLFVISKSMSDETVVLVSSIICGSGRSNKNWAIKNKRVKELVRNFIAHLPVEYSFTEATVAEVTDFYCRLIDALFPQELPQTIYTLKEYAGTSSFLNMLEKIQINEICSLLERIIIFDKNNILLSPVDTEKIYKSLVTYTQNYYKSPIIKRVANENNQVPLLTPKDYIYELIGENYILLI